MVKGIYCIKNKINNKVYIGLTTNLKTRWRHHIYLLRNGKHGNKHLQSSFNKHGEQYFIYLVLEKTNDLCKREIFWINFFGGLNNKKLYNKSTGGEGGYTMSDEFKMNCSRWQEGRKLSKEHSLNISKGNKGIKKHSEKTKKYLSDLYKGRPLLEETKLKISIAKTGVRLSESTRQKLKDTGNKPVIQYDLKMNKVKEFKSAKSAGETLNFWKSDITQNCLGNRKTVKGFIFKYK